MSTDKEIESELQRQQRLTQLESDLEDVEMKIQAYKLDQDRLTKERDALRGTLNIPTEPGWYLNRKDEICRLTEAGVWDDGWGNPTNAYGNMELYTPLRKLKLEDD